MFKTHPLFLVFALVAFSGCKKEEMQIAEKVDLRVSFAKKEMAMIFHIKPEYSVQTERDFQFDELSNIEVTYDSELQKSKVRIDISASEQSLSQKWPGGQFFQLPGGKSLPRILQDADLRQWSCCYKEELEASLFYPSDDELNFGVGLYHKRIENLEPGILIRQSFKNRKGRVVASVILIGPSDYEHGSLILIGHLGQNPFFETQDDEYLRANDVELPVEDLIQDETLTDSEVHFSKAGWFDWLWL